jgi:hypothetical protein
MSDNSKSYAAKLEAKLITEFKEKFYLKMGYEPIVVTKVTVGSSDTIPKLTLHDLEACFTPFLPERYGKTLRLGAKHRKRELVELRNIFCALARMMRYTYSDIGRHLDGRDHTTAMHNVKTFQDLMSNDEQFQEKYKRVLTHIKQTYESSDLELPDQILFESEPAVLSGLLQEQD